MLRDSNRRAQSRPLFNNLKRGSTILLIINFIETILPLFRLHCKDRRLNEEELTQELVIILLQNIKFEFPFRFIAEYRDIHTIGADRRRRVDIGVVPSETEKGTNSFFCIEAKCLPTLPFVKREREYVIGGNNNGGVERFKRELHGKELPENAMIGYINSQSFNYWFTSINKWINDLSVSNTDSSITWKKTEELTKVRLNDVSAIYKSQNIRKNDFVYIHHIWIKMN